MLNLVIPELVSLSVLVVFSSFFSGSETALFYLSRDELLGFRTGSPGQRRVADLLRSPDRLLTSILFWNLLVNLSYFAISVVVVRRLAASGHGTAAGLAGLASVTVLIIAGEVVPKSVAAAFRRQLAPPLSLPLTPLVAVLGGLTPRLLTISRAVQRVGWPRLETEPYLDSSDLERAVEVLQSRPHQSPEQREVLHNVLDLSEMSVEEVMRPRGTYWGRPAPIALSDLHDLPPHTDYIVVLDERSDGVERAIPLFSFSQLPSENLEAAAEDVIHVPWCATLADTLQLLNDSFSSVASVVDEYGTTMGIVTYEDILDTTLQTESSRAHRLLRREPVLEVAPRRFHVEGLTTLRYLARRLDLEFQQTSESVTVGGLLHDELQRIPDLGDECLWCGHRIRVIDVLQPGIVRLLVWQDDEPDGPQAQIRDH